MNFNIDEQTYRDLNVLGGNENNFSLFNLFKKTKTVGGRERIEEMMRNPFNEIDKLKARSEAIAFFAKSNFDLNINHDQFEFTDLSF